MTSTSRIKSGYGVIQRAVMTMEISQQAKLVYCLLVSYAGAAGECYPSFTTICDNLAMGRSTVNKAIKELQICGLVDIESRQAENGSKMSNLYYPLMVNSNNVTQKENKGGSTQSEPPLVLSEDYPSTQPALPLVLHGYCKNNIIKNNNEEESTHTQNSISEPSEKYSNSVKSDSEKKEKSSAKKEKKIPPENKQAYGSEKNVMLTPEEYEKLKAKDEILYELAIEKVGLHKKAKGVKYKSDYAAILNWGFKAAMEENIKIQKLKNDYSKSNNQEHAWQRDARERNEQKLRDKLARSGFG